MSPKCPSIGKYSAAVKQTCLSLAQGGRGTVHQSEGCYKEVSPSRPNITKEEHKALKELGDDNTRVVLTADKGVCLVVMDREEYIQKQKNY